MDRAHVVTIAVATSADGARVVTHHHIGKCLSLA